MLAALTACGGGQAAAPPHDGAAGAGGGGGGAGGDRDSGVAGAGDGAASCMGPAAGAFTFHVRNAGTTTLLVDLGCGSTSPLAFVTAAGTLPGGPGNVDACGFTCDAVYTGSATPGGCSDCGGGVTRSIAAGATADVDWNRLVYAEHAVDPACTAKTGMCAVGAAVPPSTAQQGTLTTCPADQHPTGSCLKPLVTSFTVDTTTAEATVDVTGP
jgi:hypothetical protein